MSKLVLAFLTLVVAVHSSSQVETTSSWPSWIWVHNTYGVYCLLAIMIIGCYVYSVLSYEANRQQTVTVPTNDQEDSVKSLFVSQRNINDQKIISSLAELRGENESKDILRETQVRNETLRMELEQLDKIRLTLEERSGVLEREKEEVEIKLKDTRQLSERLNEDLKQDVASTKTELAKVQEENEHLFRKLEVTSIEAGDMDRALKEHALLVERLEAARKEVADLHVSLQTLREERTRVMVIAADVASRCQGVAGESSSAVRQFVKRELEKSRVESAHQQTDGSSQLDVVPDPVQAVADSQENSEPEAADDQHCQLCQECTGTSNEIFGGFQVGTVTRSPAFRDFLFASLREE